MSDRLLDFDVVLVEPAEADGTDVMPDEVWNGYQTGSVKVVEIDIAIPQVDVELEEGEEPLNAMENYLAFLDEMESKHLMFFNRSMS